MGETPVWDKLAGDAARAAARGQWQLARELGNAAREAWLNHCEAVHAEEQARKNSGGWERD